MEWICSRPIIQIIIHRSFASSLRSLSCWIFDSNAFLSQILRVIPIPSAIHGSHQFHLIHAHTSLVDYVLLSFPEMISYFVGVLFVSLFHRDVNQ